MVTHPKVNVNKESFILVRGLRSVSPCSAAFIAVGLSSGKLHGGSHGRRG